MIVYTAQAAVLLVAGLILPAAIRSDRRDLTESAGEGGTSRDRVAGVPTS
jgi:hypothetical protein